MGAQHENWQLPFRGDGIRISGVRKTDKNREGKKICKYENNGSHHAQVLSHNQHPGHRAAALSKNTGRKKKKMQKGGGMVGGRKYVGQGINQGDRRGWSSAALKSCGETIWSTPSYYLLTTRNGIFVEMPAEKGGLLGCYRRGSGGVRHPTLT